MKYIRKGMSILLILVILIISTFATAYAGSSIIYQNSSGKIPVASGTTLEKISRFTDNGWLNINVLRIDTANSNIRLDTMSSSESLQKTETTKAMAQNRNAVAAVNGGFFVWNPLTPVGSYFESGSLLSATNTSTTTESTMTTFAINESNQALFDYCETSINLITASGSAISVYKYNKPYDGSDKLTVWDSKWNAKSIGTDAPTNYTSITEMVVIDGIVTEIRKNQPACIIPPNGYVVISRGAGSNLLTNTFLVGDSVILNATLNPDFGKLQMAVTAGATLLKDGKVPAKFSHIPEGTSSTRNPRTAVGSTKDGKTLLMVTIDGRQDGSIGATLTELAQIMGELGAYNAVNFDGGGSTTMVARELGTNNINLINNPSDGSMRKVNTSIGVFSTAEPTNELSGLVLAAEDDNVFVNTSRSFTLKGYDKYFNPVEVDPTAVKWSVSGVTGTFKDNVFYPKSLGRGKIKATVGNVSKEIDISILSAPVQLMLSQSDLKLALNKTKSFTVRGKNVNGYYANISSSDVTWAVKGGIGTFANGTFTAAKQGAGYIDASVGKTHAYCSVSVKTEKTSVADNFEKSGNTFISYPSTVPGSYGLSEEQKHSGKTSGKLTYDFSNVEVDRAAYIVLKNNGIALPSNSSKLGLWVYNTHKNPNWLGAWVIDSKNKQHLVYFSKDMNWTGWKYLEVSIEDIDTPSKLTRIYTVQPNPVSDIGEIYVDDLSVTTSSYPSLEAGKLPKDTVPVDGANKSTTYKKSSTSFRFAVFGQSRDPKNALEKLLVTNLVNKINSTYEASAFVGQNAHSGAKTVKKQLISTNTGYKSADIVNSRLLQLDMSKGGLRLTNSNQWHWLLNQLDTAKGSNVFLFLANSPDSFKDSKEAKLLKSTLTEYKKKTGKNVWVFYKGEKNASYMEDGIKYITTAGYEVSGLTQKNTSGAKYVLITVNGSTVTYEFKNIV